MSASRLLAAVMVVASRISRRARMITSCNSNDSTANAHSNTPRSKRVACRQQTYEEHETVLTAATHSTAKRVLNLSGPSGICLRMTNSRPSRPTGTPITNTTSRV